ncbi:tetratricopeptide repeat protein [Aliiglaciecola sp. M165]|uniref:tetratricopeptide repeat protein n=1 Tax=Aliiglaciecola sp. M165 TaxID=2593649 RepID=UPI00117C68E7|nr:tetratricopeptide repeat protein [Aliiglaciecola sp. M165]TRY29447.1 tetratricopeptide repeat protein [Aliiglaciecola sp. M165]
MKKFVKNITAIATLSAAALVSNYAAAQSSPVVCPDYKRGTTNIIGERAGKKIQKALEAYNNDLISEALELLYEIDTKQTYDRAFTDNFIGKMLAGQDGQGDKALQYLKGSVNPKALNDSEHAGTVRLVADLSMQEKKYDQAIEYYERWMTFTCKQDPDVFTRMAQAYYELKQLPKMVEPSDKAIALYEKPNKNPYVLKLQSFYERKMYPQTVAVAEELVRIFPDNKQWWSQLGFFYMLVEDYKKALSTFEIAYNQGFLSKKSEIKALAQLYATNDIPYKAAVIMEKYIKEGLIEKDDKSLANLANSWHQAREYKKAAGYYAQAAQEKEDPDYYRKQGILLHAAEDYKGALNALQKALDKGADQKGRIHIAMMEAHIYTGNFRQAMVHVREAKKDKNVERTARAWEPYIKEKAKNRGIKV